MNVHGEQVVRVGTGTDRARAGEPASRADSGGVLDPAFAGDYTYMSEAYYGLLERDPGEHPTAQEALDAYVFPVALEIARLRGIPVPPYQLSNGGFDPPALLLPVNPWSRQPRFVRSERSIARASEAMTRLGKYAFLTIPMPPGTELRMIRSVNGIPSRDEARGVDYRGITESLFQAFHLPVTRILLRERAGTRGGVDTRGVETPPEFVGFFPLPFSSLSPRERRLLPEAAQRAGRGGSRPRRRVRR